MLPAVLLYGSRARRDSKWYSDTDLLGISGFDRITRSVDRSGISFHTYPMAWMVSNAQKGELFLLHIVKEAVALFDPDGYLEQLKADFSYKKKYDAEIEVGARIIAATTILNPSRFDEVIRRRYFWGLRTTIMALAANQQVPAFSSKELENFSKLEGLEDHIGNRLLASAEECRSFGSKVLSELDGVSREILHDYESVNLKLLLSHGGFAAVTANSIIYG